MVLTDIEAIQIINDNKAVNPKINTIRENSKTLYALIDGDNFKELLIDKIEFIEGEDKSIARKKYSRDIQDFFERLFQPLENIWYATGGNKVYDIEDDKVKMEFLKKISNIKNSNTLANWIQNTAIKLSHVDPNGLIFIEYTTTPKKDIFPTYKNIKDIRSYRENGQLLEWLLFEPYKLTGEGKDRGEYWRIVDDKQDRTFLKLNDETIIKVPSKSFPHPFGEVPAIINSNIVKVDDEKIRLSPVNTILGLSKEYARDLSIKTLYKFTQGFPIHWRYVVTCEACHGRKKNDDGTNCGSCDGKGYMTNGDVTDLVVLPVPTQDSPVIAPNIAGHIKPDNETWTQYTTELDAEEKAAFRTFWGTLLGTEETFGGRKTTTEVIFNKQPIENRLNKYADWGEFVEWKISAWVLNFFDKAKAREKNDITISYGRNYVIEPSDTILKRYEESKTAGGNDVILDELFKQYLQATYRTNPIELRVNLIKSEVEPYLHYTLTEVRDVFGTQEAQRKVLFSRWWDSLTTKDLDKTVEVLIKEYKTWFESNKIVIKIEEPKKVENK
jgi:hypothetical protein